jgi:16S rRNA G966 N2-methylase RsmD
MSIRVIAGSAKGRQLKLVPGDGTRPIMDRVKEALFNIIGRKIYDSVWLDLFAGTGSVGIEALSRGAEHALLTDNDPRAIKTTPQYKRLWVQALTALDKNPAWLHADGQAIVQIDPTEDTAVALDHLTLEDQRRYGNTALLFFRFNPGEREE